MSPRLRNVLAVIVAWEVAILPTATLLFLLLHRLGDATGAACAGTIAVAAAGALVLSLAAGFLDTSAG